jgi:hypothetical protein
MGLINWIFDIYQHSKIDDARQEAAQARAEAMALRTRSGSVDPERLERAVAELALSVKTLQRLMLEKGVATQSEFAARLEQIDREDGAADGRASLR